jgi:hypothetical protein
MGMEKDNIGVFVLGFLLHGTAGNHKKEEGCPPESRA